MQMIFFGAWQSLHMELHAVSGHGAGNGIALMEKNNEVWNVALNRHFVPQWLDASCFVPGVHCDFFAHIRLEENNDTEVTCDGGYDFCPKVGLSFESWDANSLSWRAYKSIVVGVITRQDQDEGGWYIMEGGFDMTDSDEIPSRGKIHKGGPNIWSVNLERNALIKNVRVHVREAVVWRLWIILK